jgi:hypothetical protein
MFLSSNFPCNGLMGHITVQFGGSNEPPTSTGTIAQRIARFANSSQRGAVYYHYNQRQLTVSNNVYSLASRRLQPLGPICGFDHRAKQDCSTLTLLHIGCREWSTEGALQAVSSHSHHDCPLATLLIVQAQMSP